MFAAGFAAGFDRVADIVTPPVVAGQSQESLLMRASILFLFAASFRIIVPSPSAGRRDMRLRGALTLLDYGLRRARVSALRRRDAFIYA